MFVLLSFHDIGLGLTKLCKHDHVVPEDPIVLSLAHQIVQRASLFGRLLSYLKLYLRLLLGYYSLRCIKW